METEATYMTARQAVYKMVDEIPLQLQQLGRDLLVERAESKGGKRQTLEQKCVNYLRHFASAYDEINRKLGRPSELGLSGVECHVLHIERRRLVARTKERILKEIATSYPWLRQECRRQAWLDGVAGHPGEFVMSFGPFKGYKLCQLDTEYLIGMLGHSFVRGSFRTRIERHLAERIANQAKSTVNSAQFRGNGTEPDGKQMTGSLNLERNRGVGRTPSWQWSTPRVSRERLMCPLCSPENGPDAGSLIEVAGVCLSLLKINLAEGLDDWPRRGNFGLH